PVIYLSYGKMKPYKTQEDLIGFLKDNELVGLDSEYSYKCIEWIQRFSAKGMDLNSWWVLTPSTWRCPSCDREKKEIIRLNKHGYLTGHLHEHHDHMKDFVESEFSEFAHNNSHANADLLGARFVERTAFALSAYDNTVVCSDCNNADVKAKKLVFAPAQFSFSPEQIKQFIITEPNLDHQINDVAVMKVWGECKQTFELRCLFVKKFAALGATNTHWYQPSIQTARQTYRIGSALLKHHGLSDIKPNAPEKLLYKTSKFAGEKSSWRMNRLRSITIAPSEGELQHLINMKKAQWEKVADDWYCPVCQRLKIECVRKSNKGNWDFSLSTSKKLYDVYSPNFVQNTTVCNDCSTTATHIGSEIMSRVGENIAYGSALVSVDELCSVISSVPHGKHEINNFVAEKLLSILEERYWSGDFYNL
ncbi:hypothetical protein, partial [Yersinia similis]|uniref:hypothetical protein n=1 Tax=Yersinia similis TaxID=367190 RepID=UPI0016436EC5